MAKPLCRETSFCYGIPDFILQESYHAVELPILLWYSNQTTTVSEISFDFGDGLGDQSINFGEIKTVTYSQEGVKEWLYRLKLTDNQVLYSHSKIKIEAAPMRRPYGQR